MTDINPEIGMPSILSKNKTSTTYLILKVNKNKFQMWRGIEGFLVTKRKSIGKTVWMTSKEFDHITNCWIKLDADDQCFVTLGEWGDYLPTKESNKETTNRDRY